MPEEVTTPDVAGLARHLAEAPDSRRWRALMQAHIHTIAARDGQGWSDGFTGGLIFSRKAESASLYHRVAICRLAVMTEDTDTPTINLTVENGDAEGMKAALVEGGIEVSQVEERQVYGAIFLAPVAVWLLSGATYDVAKFVTKRGAKGVKELVKSTQEKSGHPEATTKVELTDEKNTTVIMPSDLPSEAYEALAKIDLSKLPGLTISWHDPPGEWRVDMPLKITLAGDDSF